MNVHIELTLQDAKIFQCCKFGLSLSVSGERCWRAGTVMNGTELQAVGMCLAEVT